MSQLRGIDADFTSFRHVQGRKVIQLTFEVPIERTAEVFNMLGSPRSGESLWCAIAPLRLKPAARDLQEEVNDLCQSSTSSEPKANGSPKKFHELPLSQQAAIRCGDVLFQEYLKVESAEGAADYVRCHCGVKSRSDIRADGPSAQRWNQIEHFYQSWLTDRKFAEAKR